MTPENFKKRLLKPRGCLIFHGAKEINGYGYVVSPYPDGPKYLTAHKFAWIIANGPVPEGMQVLHKCDIRACCNPKHLFLGGIKENSDDKRTKARGPRGEDFSQAKLNEEKARAIFEAKPEKRGRDGRAVKLAAKYNVGVGAILAVWTGRSWSHVTGLPKVSRP